MTFYIETLGCKVNTYESNVIRDSFFNEGWTESSLEKSDIVVINTCSVTNSADQKSMKKIRHAKKYNPNAILIVVGCLPQVQPGRLETLDISILLGNKGKSRLVSYIKQYQIDQKKIVCIESLDKICFEPMMLNNFDQTRAFLKIQDGCQNFCSYCIIPFTRGCVRSKKREDVLIEAQNLLNSGHQELVLTGIHTGNYGAEFNHYGFSDLVSELVLLPGLKRLRISSIEATELNDHFLSLLKQYTILVDHLHIPLQSGCDVILKRMNRKYTVKEFKHIIDKIREIRPFISITTDVIVGFPGEGEEEFQETIETIMQLKFAKIHVFPYSKRDHTIASKLDGQVDETLKNERARFLIGLSKQLELNYFESFIGQTVSVLIEQKKEGMYLGHTGNYLLVKIVADLELQGMIDVCITEVDYPYCIAKIEEEIY